MPNPTRDPGRQALRFDPGSAAWVTAEVVARPPARWSRTVVYGSALALVAALSYAAVAEIPDRVRARGEIFSTPPVQAAQALSTGRVARIPVEVDAVVEEGQVLVELDRALSADAADLARRLLLHGRRVEAGNPVEDGSALSAQLRGHREELVRAELLVEVEAVLEALRVREAQRLREPADLPVATTTVPSTSAPAPLGRAIDALAQALRRNERLYRVAAPTSGRVVQLEVARGDVVELAAVVARVAPTDSALRVRATLAEQDVAEVREGMAARLELDAFPFQEYGTVPAHILRVTRHRASSAEGRGYEAIAALDAREVSLPNGGQAAILPGMAASMNIETRERTLLQLMEERLLRGR